MACRTGSQLRKPLVDGVSFCASSACVYLRVCVCVCCVSLYMLWLCVSCVATCLQLDSDWLLTSRVFRELVWGWLQSKTLHTYFALVFFCFTSRSILRIVYNSVCYIVKRERETDPHTRIASSHPESFTIWTLTGLESTKNVCTSVFHFDSKSISLSLVIHRQQKLTVHYRLLVDYDLN